MTEAMPQLPRRYENRGWLGRGGSGTVLEAWDTQAGRLVAIKWLGSVTEEQRSRFEREARALAMLDDPGIVKLYEHSTEHGQAYLVMQRIDGRPFPAGRSWPALEPVLIELLRALGVLHGSGLVHRDLKPANVLVTDAGQPVILDFGLVGGASFRKMTTTGAIVGTPRYLAPEQLLGQPADHRADLYALGVMLYEALAGVPPHPDHDWAALWQARVARPAPRLDSVLADAPPQLTQIVAKLLARSPDDRPATAQAVLDRLEKPSGAPSAWVGPRDALDALLAACREGRRARLWGPRGSGRTHHLEVLRERLAEEGHTVHWLGPSTSPFGSLPGFVSAAESGGPRAIERSLAAALRRGDVLLADDAGGLDPWTQGLLEDSSGAIVEVRPSPGAIEVPRLSEAAVRELLVGPERLFGALSRGTELLIARAGRHAGHLLAELDRWVDEQCAVRHGDQWTIDPARLDALDALARQHPPLWPPAAGARAALSAEDEALLHSVLWAWPSATVDGLALTSDEPSWVVRLRLERLQSLGWLAPLADGLRVLVDPGPSAAWAREAWHRRYAATLTEDPSARLTHLLRSDDVDALRPAVVAEVTRLGRSGDRGAALALAERAAGKLGALDESALVELTRLAALTQDRAHRESTGALLERQGRSDLAQLVHSAARVFAGASHDEVTRGWPDPLPEQLEIVSWFTRWQEARREGGAEAEDALLSWALVSVRERHERATVLSWTGLAAYRRGDFEAASARHLQAADLREGEARLQSELNAASALAEAGRFDRSEALARSVLDAARAHRQSSYEVHATSILRSIDNGRGATNPDLALVDAAAWLGPTQFGAWLLCTEALIAHRGAHPEAPELANKALGAATGVGLPWGELVAKAMVVSNGGGDPTAVLERARDCPFPVITLDVVAMVYDALPDHSRPQARRLASKILSEIPEPRRSICRGRFSPHEAASRIGVEVDP